VKEGVSGCLVTQNDPDRFAEALLFLLASPQRRQKMGEAAKRCASHFDIRRTKEKIEALYEEVLKP